MLYIFQEKYDFATELAAHFSWSRNFYNLNDKLCKQLNEYLADLLAEAMELNGNILFIKFKKSYKTSSNQLLKKLILNQR